MMRIKENVTIRKSTGIFGLEPAIGGKGANNAKFTRQFVTRFSRQISVQLDTFNAGRVCRVTNFAGSWINKYPDRANAARNPFNHLLRSLWFDVARTSRINV